MAKWCVIFQKDDIWSVKWYSDKDTLRKRVKSIGENNVISIIEINKEYDTNTSIRKFLELD